MKINQWLGSGAAKAFGWEARQSTTRIGGASGYIMRAFAIGSSDFFSFSDDYKIFALRDSKPSPLNKPSQRIQTSLCSSDLSLLSRSQRLQQLGHGFQLSLQSISLKRANFFGVVANAASFLSLLHGSPARHWQTRWVCFMLGHHPQRNSTHRDGRSPLRWYESLLSVLAVSLLFREKSCPSRPPAFFLPGTCEARRRVSLCQLCPRMPHSLHREFSPVLFIH